MAVKKSDKVFNDAKGNTHKHFADGRSEIYIGGYDALADYVEVTDMADTTVNRKRFLRQTPQRVEDTLQAREDPEESAVPGIDSLDHEIAHEAEADED